MGPDAMRCCYGGAPLLAHTQSHGFKCAYHSVVLALAGLAVWVPPLASMVLAVEAVWYAGDIVAVVRGKKSRKERLISCVHHGILLSMLAYAAPFHDRTMIALPVISTHKPADIILYAMRFFRERGWERGVDVSFGAILAVWPITRLLIFPIYVVWPLYGRYPPWAWPWPWAAAAVITGLNAYWTGIIARVGIRYSRGAVISDPR